MMNRPPSAPNRPQDRLDYLLLALIGLGFGLRLFQLDRNSLWFDEIVLTWLSRPSFFEGLDRLIGQGIQFAPLDHLIIRGWRQVGQSDWLLRFPSLAFSLLTIPLMYQLGRRYFNRATGLFAAALWAANPFQVWYAQEAKGYALLALAAAGSMYAFAGLLNGQGKKTALQMIGFNALGFNTHYFMFLIPTVQFAFLLLDFKKYHLYLRKWVPLQILSASTLLPWFGYIFLRQRFATGIGWIPQPAAHDLLLTLWNFTLGYTEELAWPIVVALGVVFTTLAAGMVNLGRFRPANRLVLVWFYLPLIVVWSLSQGRLSFYVDRYFQIITPALILLLAVGVTAIERRRRKIGLGLALLLATVYGLSQLYLKPAYFTKDDWRAMAGILRREARAGDGLVTCTDGYRLALDYYDPGDLFARQAQQGELYYVYPAAIDFDAVLAKYDRFWLITSNPRRPQHHLGYSYPPLLERDRLSPANQRWLAAHPPLVVGVAGITAFVYRVDAPPDLNELIRWNCETG